VRIGLHLAGTPADAAALALLGEAAPDLSEGTWSVAHDPAGPASAVDSPAIDAARARALAARGLPLVAVHDEPDALVLTPLAAELAPAGPALRWPAPLRRAAPRLLEALRPRRVPGEPLADEALFVLRPDSPAPRRLLERLLLLGRGDAQVTAFTAAGQDAPSPRFAVRVKLPPVYLLMAARDDESGEVAVYARVGHTPLWVAWSYEHPLAPAAVAALVKAGQAALVDRDGAWLRTQPEWRARSIYDAVAPELAAPRVDLHPAEPDRRFRVPLRLAPGEVADADLWLLTPDQLLDLEPLIDVCTADELGRLTVARLTGAHGTVYLVRERVRPGAARMAARVSEALGQPGYVQVAGADNLYIPAGRRLVPLLRRDDLRALLGLDRAHTVVLTEDRDGPRVVAVAEVDEQPLLRWIDYVATDRRLELDRLLERSVFEWPEVTVEWPEQRRPPVERPPPREPRHPRRPRRDAPAPEPAPAAPLPADDPAAQLRALRERARGLERALLAGGHDDPTPWRELGELKAALGEPDEAAACLEQALVHGGPPYELELAARLVEVTSGMSFETWSEDQLAELVVADRRTPAESARLGAALVARLAAGRPPPDEVMQLALPAFADPRLPVSRRLAWSALAAWHHHARDRLGLTRAKEAILGGINERGLSELHDLPRFVRYALAREADDDDAPGEARGDRPQQGQLVALEALWHDAQSAGLPDLDVLADYTRLIFAVGFARLGARQLAQEIVAPIDQEIDVHEVPNRALFRLYLARLAHEGSGSTEALWAADVARIVDAIKEPKHRQAALWLQRRSMWLRTSAADESLVGRPTRFALPPGLELADLAEHLAREMIPAPTRFDFMIAEAVDVCLRRALASGSEALVADVLAAAEPGLGRVQILSHRAEAIAACIHAAASLGNSDAVGRLLDGLVEIARSDRLGSVRELTRAVERGFIALRRFGGLEPARELLELLAGLQAYTSSDRIHLLATVASGLVQLGEGSAADALLDRLCAQILDGSFDYVGRAQAGLAVAGALRHWPNVARVERFRRFMARLDVFRDTFTAGRFYDTHKVQILEAVVDSLADSRTRHSDRIQGFLDQEEHALRRRIVADWSALCGR
jgi:hypothetical protein